MIQSTSKRRQNATQTYLSFQILGFLYRASHMIKQGLRSGDFSSPVDLTSNLSTVRDL